MALSVASGLGALNAVEDLLAGAAVTIGGIGLSSLEVPASMPWGGDQRLAVHELVGGGRQIDVLGPADADIEWSGYFTGGAAVSRARQVDALRLAGNQVALTWADFSRQVIIQSFKADYTRAGSVVPYRITCVVITGNAVAQAPTLLSQLGSDISSALGLSNLLPAAQTAIQAVQTALPIGAVLTGGSPAFVALQGAVGTAVTAVGAAQTLAGSQLTAIATQAGSSGQIFGGSAGLLAASAAQDASAAASQAAGFIGRAATNLGL